MKRAKREKLKQVAENHRHESCFRKKKYKNYEEAMLTIHQCGKYGAKDLTTYYCPFCKNYHLTQQ